MGENLSTVFKMGVALITLCATLTVMMFIMVMGRTLEQNTIESVAQLTEEQLIELSDYQHTDYPFPTLHRLLEDVWKDSETLKCVQLLKYEANDTTTTKVILWQEELSVSERQSILNNNTLYNKTEHHSGLNVLLDKYAHLNGRISKVTDNAIYIVMGG